MDMRRKGRVISSHPKMTPAKLAELKVLREKIDREEKDQIIAIGRAVFARHDRIKAAIGRLKAARLDRQLSLDDISAKTGIDKGNLSRLENDERPNPTVDTLLRVADAVGLDTLAV